MDVYTEITRGDDSAGTVEAVRSTVANPMTNGLIRLFAKRERIGRIPRRGGYENDYAGLLACNADEESNCRSIWQVKTRI